MEVEIQNTSKHNNSLLCTVRYELSKYNVPREIFYTTISFLRGDRESWLKKYRTIVLDTFAEKSRFKSIMMHVETEIYGHLKYYVEYSIEHCKKCREPFVRKLWIRKNTFPEWVKSFVAERFVLIKTCSCRSEEDDLLYFTIAKNHKYKFILPKYVN